MNTIVSSQKFILLFFCLFVVMIGYGVLLPVLPYFIEQLDNSTLSANQVTFHFGILTAIYPVTLVFSAPFCGSLSDRIGTKKLILIGLGGFVLMQLMIAFSTTIEMLYFSRIVGSLLSSFLVPVIIANLSDITKKEDRIKIMAWAGTAISAGVIVGPGLSGILIESDLHILIKSLHITIGRFSIPFIGLAFLGLISIVASFFILPKITSSNKSSDLKVQVFFSGEKWNQYKNLLMLSLIIQFIITAFETVLILQLKSLKDFSISFIGFSLLVCGLVMAVFQPIVAKWGNYIMKGGTKQIFIGFLFVGIILTSFLFSQNKLFIIIVIGLFGLGTSFIIPNLLAQISLKNSDSSGWAFGMVSSFGGVGQILGPLVGTSLFLLNSDAPYILMAIISIATSFFILKYKNVFVKKEITTSEII